MSWSIGVAKGRVRGGWGRRTPYEYSALGHTPIYTLLPLLFALRSVFLCFRLCYMGHTPIYTLLPTLCTALCFALFSFASDYLTIQYNTLLESKALNGVLQSSREYCVQQQCYPTFGVDQSIIYSI